MKTVFLDVDTQIDFLYPAGALYVSGAEKIVPVVARLNQHAAAHGIPVVSTMDAHAENDPEFRDWPPHCVVGTAPQQKPASTLLEPRVVVPAARTTVSLDGARQIIIEKQTTDCFTNANIEQVLRALKAERCVVYGVVTEVCVKNAVMGLLMTGRRVELVTDAIQHLDPTAAREMKEEFTASGGVLTTSAAVLAG
jgi:nicotinamidase/pyrazinamidase